MSGESNIIERESVIEVTRAVCECLLGDSAEPSPEPHVAGGPSDVAAWVTISGAWSGSVRIRLPPSLATRLARELLQVEPSSTDDPGVRDVAGEVANMIGGNLKALLPEPCRLSLPQVVIPATPTASDLSQSFAIGADSFEVSVKSTP